MKLVNESKNGYSGVHCKIPNLPSDISYVEVCEMRGMDSSPSNPLSLCNIYVFNSSPKFSIWVEDAKRPKNTKDFWDIILKLNKMDELINALRSSSYEDGNDKGQREARLEIRTALGI